MRIPIKNLTSPQPTTGAKALFRNVQHRKTFFMYEPFNPNLSDLTSFNQRTNDAAANPNPAPSLEDFVVGSPARFMPFNQPEFRWKFGACENRVNAKARNTEHLMNKQLIKNALPEIQPEFSLKTKLKIPRIHPRPPLVSPPRPPPTGKQAG